MISDQSEKVLSGFDFFKLDEKLKDRKSVV
jgi:hypothetical protein